MAEENPEQSVLVVARDPIDSYELMFKVKTSKSVKKIMQAWHQNMPPEKEHLEYEFFFGDMKLHEDQKYCEIPGLVNDAMEVVISCIRKQATAPAEIAGAEKVTNEDAPEAKTTTEEAHGDQAEAEKADLGAAVEKSGTDNDFLPAEESPTTAPPADDRLKSGDRGEEQDEKDEKEEREGKDADDKDAPMEDAGDNKESGEEREEKKNEDAPMEDAGDNEGGEERGNQEAPEDGPAPEAEKEKGAEAAQPSPTDDEPIQICVKDSSDGDVLTFRVRPSKSVGKMINAWKTNQPQYKQQCNTFSFVFGDKELAPTMTFADLPGLTEGSTIEVILTPKEAQDGEEAAGKPEKREAKEKPEKAAKKPRVAKEKVEKPAKEPKEKAPPKEKPEKKKVTKHEKKEDAGNGADVPQTAKIQIQQDNPKRAGTKSYERYDGYKKATTRAEYYELGGAKADWTYDFTRGWITVLEEE